MKKKLKSGWCAGLLLISAHCSLAQNNTIFYGGIGEGSASLDYAQSYTDIRKGGVGDGISSSNYAQAYTDIRKGGIGDGFSIGGYAQQYDDVRKGGIGDGWSSTVIAMQPLPLLLLSFTGKDLNGDHLLEWTTTDEKNTSHFLLEHTNIPSKSYITLGRIAAAGESNTRQQYDFLNENPNVGDNYYRLRMVDLDGKETFSNVVLLKVMKNNISLLLYPNPTASALNLKLANVQDNSPVHLEVYDMNGRKLSSFDIHHDTPVHTIDVSQLAAGNYFIHIQAEGIRENIKFTKIN